MRAALPDGFGIALDPSTRVRGDLVWGGTPWRLLRLTPSGIELLSEMRDGAAVSDARSGALARRLVDAGLAHPRPPGSTASDDVGVVVPVRDRADELDRCLASLTGLDVTVVDDGSEDPRSVAAVAARHGATLVRRKSCGGPAAARNTGLGATEHSLVAFVDSDCEIDAGALLAVAGHLADPCVAAAAPRIREQRASSPLDLGPDEALVLARGRVSYLPTTAVVVRRTALDAVGGFDESLRYGEDVDLVWRLVAAGWSVRYDPSVHAQHVAPSSVLARAARRYRYGTSAGPLAQRHGAAVGGPALSGFLAPLRVGTLRRAGLPIGDAIRLTAQAPLRTAAALLRWSVTDNVAYRAGVIRGCVDARTLRPLLPTTR